MMIEFRTELSTGSYLWAVLACDGQDGKSSEKHVSSGGAFTVIPPGFQPILWNRLRLERHCTHRYR